MKYINIACGERYSNKWVNIDFHAHSSHVKKVNILSGLPFDDASFEVVYCSHFLEHLSIDQATTLIREVKRILKKNGIFRVIVPDLENICREYLKILDDIKEGKKIEKRYKWIVIELIDQFVRVESGGQMGKFFNKVIESDDTDLADYIRQRTGDQLTNKKLPKKRVITFDKVKNKVIYFYLKCIQFLVPKSLRDLVFVNTSIGERHQWMYDEYSMVKLLESEGFNDICIEQYNTSKIDNFNSYMLDINPDGTPYKGVSSLYVEAIK